jgi:hypothetical protein
MNTSSAPSRGGRRVPRWACAVAATGILLTLAACQSPAPNTEQITEAAPRTAPVRPAGIDIDRPADRIDEVVRRIEAEREARYSGRPADRIEEQLIREQDAAVGRVPGCLRHVVVAAPRAEEALVCIDGAAE